MGVPHAEQVAAKEQACRDLLADHADLRWLPPVVGREDGYRNKAKMVVGGTVDAPTLGILDGDGHGVDLRACGICSPGLRAALPVLAGFVTRARLVPYDVPSRTGELKHLLVTESPDGALMVRFVLRSQEPRGPAAQAPALRCSPRSPRSPWPRSTCSPPTPRSSRASTRSC